MDDYDRQSDRIYFRFAPPVETHGCPIFYEGRWVGNVTTETEPNRSVVVPGEHRPLYVNKTDRGIGVGVVLASLGCAGVPAEQWPPEPQSDSDSDASENRPATPPPLNTPFERPRLPEPEFNGYAGHHVFDRSKRGRSYIGGSGIALRARLGDGPRNRPTGRARHDRPARAIKAVHEANIEALAELQAEDDDPNFLRDLRFARGWTLAHVAATTGNGAMLVPLAECGVDLWEATPLGDTVAHTAAYHGCIGALRVLKARGLPINAENNRGERPVHKALLRRHEACVAWFKEGAAPSPSCRRRSTRTTVRLFAAVGGRRRGVGARAAARGRPGGVPAGPGDLRTRASSILGSSSILRVVGVVGHRRRLKCDSARAGIPSLQ